jgi:hypothetical protein
MKTSARPVQLTGGKGWSSSPALRDESALILELAKEI